MRLLCSILQNGIHHTENNAFNKAPWSRHKARYAASHAKQSSHRLPRILSLAANCKCVCMYVFWHLTAVTRHRNCISDLMRWYSVYPMYTLYITSVWIVLSETYQLPAETRRYPRQTEYRVPLRSTGMCDHGIDALFIIDMPCALSMVAISHLCYCIYSACNVTLYCYQTIPWIMANYRENCSLTTSLCTQPYSPPFQTSDQCST